ncbi:MAG: hypothetical protein GY751_06230, partial [Bacteroidetes bacterium]|nr:hypothetical protein [Bacteroidota bacterium]
MISSIRKSDIDVVEKKMRKFLAAVCVFAIFIGGCKKELNDRCNDYLDEVGFKGTAGAKDFNETGMKYYKQKEYPKAEDLFRCAVKEDSDNARAYYNLACLLSLQYEGENGSRIREIVSSLKKAIELNKKYIKAAVKEKDFNQVKNSKEFMEYYKDLEIEYDGRYVAADIGLSVEDVMKFLLGSWKLVNEGDYLGIYAVTFKPEQTGTHTHGNLNVHLSTKEMYTDKSFYTVYKTNWKGKKTINIDIRPEGSDGNSISGAFGWKILYIDKNILKVECTFPGIEGVLT